jgi:hypothetical protein
LKGYHIGEGLEIMKLLLKNGKVGFGKLCLGVKKFIKGLARRVG